MAKSSQASGSRIHWSPILKFQKSHRCSIVLSKFFQLNSTIAVLQLCNLIQDSFTYIAENLLILLTQPEMIQSIIQVGIRHYPPTWKKEMTLEDEALYILTECVYSHT